MATANIALSFTSKTPTLEEVLGMLKEIKKISAEKIDLKINATETAKATKQTTGEMKQQKELLKMIKDEVIIAEQSYKRQAINHRQLQKEYGNAINMLREMGNQEKLIENYSTKIWVAERNITTEIQKQQVASDNLHKKIQDGLDRELKLRQNITKEKVKLTDMDRLQVQAMKINQTRDAQKATGFMDKPSTIGNSYLEFQMLRLSKVFVTSELSGMIKLEQEVYNLGAVSEATVGQIDTLMNSFLKLSTTIPISATEIVRATDEIARIGFGLEDAISIAQAGAKLAVASGDSINGVTSSLGKLMVTMNMFNRPLEDVVKLTDKMQSVALNTPLSMQSISEGMRHASSAMAIYADSTDKTGRELELYKDKVIEVGLALEGAFALKGKTGSQAGLSVREYLSKLPALDSTAKKRFNQDTEKLYFDEATKSVNKLGQGIKITADYLSELALQDLPLATEMLSKLTVSGDLSIATIKKMKINVLHNSDIMSKVA